MLRFELKLRKKPLPYSEILIPVTSCLLGILVASIILGIVYGISPLYTLRVVLTSFTWINILRFAIPLILCGAGLCIAFRANIWNIGAEGQLVIGAIAATWIALYTPMGRIPIIAIIVMIFMGFIAGALWALVAGILRLRLEVNEVLSTLMLNYVAYYFADYLVYGPWKGVHEYGYPRSDTFPKTAWLMHIPRTTISPEALTISIIAATLLYLIIKYTKIGYEIRMYGANPEAAFIAGIDPLKVVTLAMILSGGVAGIAGVFEVAGVHYRLLPGVRVGAGLGYTAIIVAWLARLNPLVTIITGIFIAGLRIAADTLQIEFQTGMGTSFVFIGSILVFLIALEVLTKFKVIIKWSR